MKKTTRIAAMLLAVLMVLSVLEGCGKSEPVVNVDANMKKGEFYYYFIKTTGLYPLDYSEEEMEAATDYHIEAETLYDWYIIDEDDMKKLDDPVTRDIVAKACMRYLTFREEHKVDNIKDIDMCSDKQAVMDAVAYGMFKLENGYFNAKHAVTYTECDEAIAKMKSIDAEGHYPEREPVIEYNDDVVIIEPEAVIDYEELIPNDDIEESQDVSMIPESTGFFKLTYAGENLGSLGNSVATNLGQGQGPQVAVKLIIKQDYFERNRHLIYPDMVVPTEILTGPGSNAGVVQIIPTYGYFRITQISEKSPVNGQCTIWGIKATFEEAVKAINNDPFCAKMKQGAKVTPSEVKEGVNVELVPGGIKFTYKHTFELKEDKYKNPKSYWRNAKITPELVAEVTIDNFAIDVDKFSDLIWKREAEWNLKISYDTETHLNLSSGALRFSPADNGNGGLKWNPEDGFSGNWYANIKNSRPTDADSKGSTGIKIMQINVPIAYGFSANMDVYILVYFDGSIDVRIVNTGNYGGLKIKKTRKNGLQLSSTSGKKETRRSVDIKLNLDLAISLEPNIAWNGKKLIDLQVQVHGVTTCLVHLAMNGKKSQSLYLTDNDMDDLTQANPGIEFCLDVSLRIFPKVIWFSSTKKETSIVRDFLDFFKIKVPQKEFDDWFNGSWHFENGSKVEKCTKVEQELKDKIDSYDGVSENKDGSVGLSSYKVIMQEGEGTDISLMSVPFSPSLLEIFESLEFFGVSPYSVESDNPDVVSASFNSRAKTICINAKGVGSATITFRIGAAGWRKDKATCAISVTVTKSKEANVNSPYIILPADIPFFAAS